MRPDYCSLANEPCQSMCDKPCSAHRLKINPEQAEPVAWIDDSGHPKHVRHLQSSTERRLYGPLRPLYATPPQRKPLPKERIEEAYRHIYSNMPDGLFDTKYAWVEQGIRYAEAAHGIKEGT